MIPAEFVCWYQNKLPQIQRLQTIVRQTLFSYSEKNHFAFSNRIKEISSLFEKIDSGRYNSTEEIDDFYAATIIIPNLNIESEVVSFLDRAFDIQVNRNRSTIKKSPDVFRFDSTRVICKLGDRNPDHNDISDITFEVQVQTALEHAWAVATHALSYKGKEIDWRIIRFCSQLKASVEQLDMIIASSETVIPGIQEAKSPEIDIKKEIAGYFNKYQGTQIPEEVFPRNIALFCSSMMGLCRFLGNSERNAKQGLEKVLSLLNAYLSNNDFPNSLSLYQTIVGILAESGVSFSGFDKCIFVSNAMRSIFPRTKEITKRFEVKV